MGKSIMRTLVWLLLLAFTFSAAISCADNKSDAAGSDTSTAPEVEKEYLDNLPADTNLDGRKIRLLSSDESSFKSVEEAIDVVDTAVYNRNLKIEERLNYTVEPVFDTGWGVVKDKLVKSVTANSDDFDLYAGYGYWSISLASDGHMRNLANMPNIDMSQPYWGKKFIDAMAYKNYIYWLTGDIVLNYTNGIYATFVNHDQWKDRFSEVDLYQLVLDGGWTLDKMAEYAAASYSDLNGNSKVDKDDFCGYVFTTEDDIDGMSIAAGVRFTEFDTEGVPFITITDKGLDTAVKFAEKLSALCWGPGSFCAPSDDCKTMFTMFGNLHAMFTVGRLAHGSTYLRDMKEDFAIIPAPKLDETQETYLTTLHDGTTIIGIPKTVNDDAAIAVCAVLEGLAAESYKSLTPVYLDVALKNKYTRDEKSAEMIDLIRKNIVSDFGFQYTATGFNNFFRSRTKTGVGVATHVAKSQKSWEKSLETILKSLEKNAG